MNQAALGRATQALRAAQAQGIPIEAPLVDQTPLGSFWVRVGVAIGATDTNVAIQLSRKPSAYIVVRSSNGAAVYDGTTPAAWTGSNITLRATSATVVSVLIG